MHKVYDGVGHPEVGATSDPGFPAVFVEIDFSPLDFGIKVTSYAKSTSRATGKNPFTILVVKGQNEIREEGCLMRFIIQDVLPPDNRCCKRRYKGVTLTDIVLDVRVVKVFFLLSLRSQPERAPRAPSGCDPNAWAPRRRSR